MKDLYDEQSKQIMLSAETSSTMRMNRIEAIRRFAQSSEYKRIGIANCASFNREAAIICDYLNRDFEVFRVIASMAG